MSHRQSAALVGAAGAAAAVLIAFAGVSSAHAHTISPKAKLATSRQSALLAARTAVGTVTAPSKSAATIALYADGKRVSGERKRVFRHGRSLRVALSLTDGGVKRLRRCSTRELELRMTLRRGHKTTTVSDRGKLVLDANLCAASVARPASAPAPAHAPASPDQPAAAKAADAPAKDKSLFRVGTSVVDITPDKPMVVGGYGANYLVTNGARDPLQVRAFFVGHGDQAVTLVSVDSQGWFASYQSPNAGDGQADARRDAAKILADRGYKVDAANVVVSATHDHAAPTIMGIWGHTDPDYLHKVKEATVKAVADAEAGARDAELWSSTGTIKGLVSQVQGTDQMAGFAVDAELPVLWAREPGTGKTVGLYADVPVHVDQYNPINASDHKFSADYPGYVRDRLAETLGGRSVIAAGTLGRQEAIGGSSEYAEVEEQGRFITNAVMRALTNAHRITDTTLGASTQSFSTAAENTGLLAAMSCNHPGGPLGACPGGSEEPAGNNGTGTWFWAPGSLFTINRSLASPWFPTSGGLKIGTSSTVARIGDQLYATAPGEAFPEVTSAIQRTFAATDGIKGVHIVDHAGDQLGYYWDQRANVYPAAQLAQSDFARFNVGSKLAQDNVNAARAAGAALGLDGTAQNPYAEIDNPDAFDQPTVQFYSNRVETDNPAVSIYVTAKKAQKPGSASTSFGSTAATQGDASVSFDYGDGTTGTQPVGNRMTHTFPGPGNYRVQASVTDNLGTTYRWVQFVRIDKPLGADINLTGNGEVTARAIGGAGPELLAAHWTFSDGSTAEGDSVKVPNGATTATLTIVDGAGNTATKTAFIG